MEVSSIKYNDNIEKNLCLKCVNRCDNVDTSLFANNFNGLDDDLSYGHLIAKDKKTVELPKEKLKYKPDEYELKACLTKSLLIGAGSSGLIAACLGLPVFPFVAGGIALALLMVSCKYLFLTAKNRINIQDLEKNYNKLTNEQKTIINDKIEKDTLYAPQYIDNYNKMCNKFIFNNKLDRILNNKNTILHSDTNN